MECIQRLLRSAVVMSSSHRIAPSGPPGAWPRRLVAGHGRRTSVLLAAVVGGAAGLATGIAPAMRVPAVDVALARSAPSVARVLVPATDIEDVAPRDSREGSP
jgi:hypothetical protein